MTRSTQDHTPKRRLSYTEKMAATAGSLSALCLLPAVAGASVIQVTGSPVSLAVSALFGTTVTWDVDGGSLNTGHEFELWRNATAIQLASGTATGAVLNGRGLVGPSFYTDNVQALNASFNVGPSLANGLVWGKNVSGGYMFRNAMSGSGYNIGYDFNYGFNAGDNFFGFRFEDGLGDLHYGFATINFDTVNGIVTIADWAYETTADTAVHVEPLGNAPEPGALSLMLLGLGAGGLGTWRARKKARAATAA